MSCDTAGTVAAIRAVAATIAEHKVELTRLDRDIGDGDHGENLSRGFTAVLTKLDGAEPDTPAAVLKLVASTLISTVGGAAGPLFGTAFLRASTAVKDVTTMNAQDVVTALTAGRDGVVARGKAELEDKTMVDALTPAVNAARAAADAGGDVTAVLRAAATDAALGAEATIPLQARKGRASYLGERSIGHKDPGATSTAYLLAALADAAEQTFVTVGIVLVSHSAQLAAGLAEVAAQMAPNVAICPAGGLEDGSIGTSFDLITAAIGQADSGDGAILLYDLGSGYLTAETAIEFLEGEQAERVVIVDAPFVLAAVSGSIAANVGSDLRGVIAAALDARSANGPGGVRSVEELG